MKIKKYALHVLILIMLVGIFIPVAQVDASAYSDCIQEQTDLRIGEPDFSHCVGLDGDPRTSSASGLGCKLGNNPTFQFLVTYITCIISQSVIPLIFALAIAMFVWGVVQYVINSSEEAKKEKGRQFMMWGIIALAVMVSVWGLVRILGNTFGIDYAVPQVKVNK